MRYRARIRAKNRNDALDEGGKTLGVDPLDIFIPDEANEKYTIAVKDSPGVYEIEIRDNKMPAILKPHYC